MNPHDLRVELTGRVDGHVRVVKLEVKGALGQDVACSESVLVHSTGRIQGRLRCADLEIERGGRVTGQVVRWPT